MYNLLNVISPTSTTGRNTSCRDGILLEVHPFIPLVPHTRVERFWIHPALPLDRHPLRCEVARERVPRLDRAVGRTQSLLPQEAQAVLAVVPDCTMGDRVFGKREAEQTQAVLLVGDADDTQAMVGANANVSFVLHRRYRQPLVVCCWLVDPVPDALLYEC